MCESREEELSGPLKGVNSAWNHLRCTQTRYHEPDIYTPHRSTPPFPSLPFPSLHSLLPSISFLSPSVLYSISLYTLPPPTHTHTGFIHVHKQPHALRWIIAQLTFRHALHPQPCLPPPFPLPSPYFLLPPKASPGPPAVSLNKIRTRLSRLSGGCGSGGGGGGDGSGVALDSNEYMH